MVPYTINPPDSDVEFEKICLALLKLHWTRPGLDRFGKKGENQYGVDIFDTFGEEPLYAAQCKLKEQTKSLSPGDITEEVDKAKTFPSKIDHYAIMTTAKVSGEAQLTIQSINKQNRADGLFTVELFTWDKITELLRQYPDVERQFYGGFRSEEVAAFSSKLDNITDISESISTTVMTSAIDTQIDEARNLINPGEAQIALLQLNRIQRTKGADLTDWHRFRIQTNLGAANLMLGKGTEAARHFLDAAPLQPFDELAVANEALAYHLLGDDELTREKVSAAKVRFPNSTRVRSLWIQAAPLDAAYQDLLIDTPVHMRKDAEVALALARRAMAANQIEAGIQHAENAVEDKPKWAQSYLFLAQAQFGRVVIGDRSSSPLTGAGRTEALQKADSTANIAVTVAEAEGPPYIASQALALKADIAFIEGRKEDGARYSRQAFGADPSDINGRLALAQAALALGNRDEAIRILEENHAGSERSPNVNFMLGEALLARGNPSDLIRAYEVFSSATLTNLKQELIDPITIGAARALTLSGNYASVIAYAERPEVIASPALSPVIKAYPTLKHGRDVEGNRLLDEAIASVNDASTASTIDLLIRILMEFGRWSDALPLAQVMFSKHHQFDPNLLLNCAGRLRRDDVILETFDVLHSRGFRSWDTIEPESQYLERYDYPKAIDRLQEFISANPDNRVAPLRLAIVAMRFRRQDLVRISLATLPSPDELPMRYAVAVIHALQWTSQSMAAVDYAYRLLRSHYSEIDAHAAYLSSLTPGACPDDLKPTMDTAEVGSAIQYTREYNPAPEWLVIEDTEQPSADFEEISASSELAIAVLGKRVGDTFVRLKSPIKDHVGTIVQIVTKYTRRFQAIGPLIEEKFANQSMIWTMTVPPPEMITAADLQPMLDNIQSHSEAVLKVRDLYKTLTITLHMFGKRFGDSAHGALFDLAQTRDQFIQCAPPDVASLTLAMSAITIKNNVVLDLVALGTLRLLGVTRQLLSSGTCNFVISAATYASLQQLRAKARFSTAHGTMYYVDGRHYMTHTTQEETDSFRAAFEEWMTHVETNTRIEPASEVARLHPDKRDKLEQILGEEGLQSAMLALRPGHILWSDDFVACEVAKSELGVQRVWTQAVSEQLASTGLIDRSLADAIHAKLIGYDFQSTHFTASVMLAALRTSGYSTTAFPMSKMVTVFGELTMFDRRSAFGLLGDFILLLTIEPLLPETRCEATKVLLGTFPNDSTTNAQLDLFAKRCARSITLMANAEEDFRRCYESWRHQRISRTPLITVG